jgi:hypothetical protein
MGGKMICFLIIGGLIFSIYYTIRAIKMTRLEPDMKMTRKQYLIIWVIFQGLFNCVCSVIGWFSLYCIYEIVKSIKDLSQISIGTSMILIFLSIVGIVGVVGLLPQVLLTQLKDLLRVFGIKN